MSTFTFLLSLPLAAMLFAISGNAQPIAKPAANIPDEAVIRIVFQIMRQAPPPHWDWEARLKWAMNHGLTESDARELETAAGLADFRSAHLRIILSESGKIAAEPQKEEALESRRAAARGELRDVLIREWTDLKARSSFERNTRLDTFFDKVRAGVKQDVPVSRTAAAGHEHH